VEEGRGSPAAHEAAAGIDVQEQLGSLLPADFDISCFRASDPRRMQTFQKLQEAWQGKRPGAYAAYVSRHAVPAADSLCACCSSQVAVVSCLDCKVMTHACSPISLTVGPLTNE
jgi:hypothetical protein